MKKIFAFVFFTFHYSLFVCHAQTATITDATVQGKAIVLTYDITDAQQGQTFDIELWYSTNAASYQKCSSLSSSGGLTELTAGNGKQITWNVLQDLQRLEANTIDFEVHAAVKAKNSFAINADFTVEGIAMRGIQGGTFAMGSTDCESYEKPSQQVTLGNFAIMKTELTVAQFKVFIDETSYQTDADKRTGGYGSYCWNGSSWEKKDGVNWKCDVSGSLRPQSEYNHPVIHVSLNDALAYSRWFSRKTGQTWRLPTEAEWEYAARGGQKYKYSKSSNLGDQDWYRSNSRKKTYPVGQQKPNGFGVYDMDGNVWEWCSSDMNRVVRGGSSDIQSLRCGQLLSPDYRNKLLGFRLVSPK